MKPKMASTSRGSSTRPRRSSAPPMHRSNIRSPNNCCHSSYCPGDRMFPGRIY
jgi:hypothetical protein